MRNRTAKRQRLVRRRLRRGPRRAAAEQGLRRRARRLRRDGGAAGRAPRGDSGGGVPDGGRGPGRPRRRRSRELRGAARIDKGAARAPAVQSCKRDLRRPEGLCRLAALGRRRRRQTKGRVAADDNGNRGPGRRR